MCISLSLCVLCETGSNPNSILISTSSQGPHFAHSSHLRDTLRHLAHSMRYSKGSQKCSKSIWIRSVSKMKPRAIHSRKLANVPLVVWRSGSNASLWPISRKFAKGKSHQVTDLALQKRDRAESCQASLPRFNLSGETSEG